MYLGRRTLGLKQRDCGVDGGHRILTTPRDFVNLGQAEASVAMIDEIVRRGHAGHRISGEQKCRVRISRRESARSGTATQNWER